MNVVTLGSTGIQVVQNGFGIPYTLDAESETIFIFIRIVLIAFQTISSVF